MLSRLYGVLGGFSHLGLGCPCSVIVDAVKMDSVQTVCSSLEPLLRKVVSLLLSIVVSKSIFWDKIPARFIYVPFLIIWLMNRLTTSQVAIILSFCGLHGFGL